jgi:hypothetical protein
MTACRTLLSLALLLLPLGASAAPPDAGAISIALRCDACSEADRPSLGLLWRADEGQEPPLASLEITDWAAGTFTFQGPGQGRHALTGEPLDEGQGWLVRVPLRSMSAPFRIVAALPGFAADRAAWWPEREAGPYAVSFRPVGEVLDAHPAWDPQRTGECDVLVPTSVEIPVTLYVQGQPRAWLYPAEDAADGTHQWTFQFVRPGQGLLERVSVLVPAFREGDAWSFRLPLQGVLGGGATWPASASGAPESSAGPADEIRIGGAGTIRLQDCPRATR